MFQLISWLNDILDKYFNISARFDRFDIIVNPSGKTDPEIEVGVCKWVLMFFFFAARMFFLIDGKVVREPQVRKEKMVMAIMLTMVMVMMLTMVMAMMLTMVMVMMLTMVMVMMLTMVQSTNVNICLLHIVAGSLTWNTLIWYCTSYTSPTLHWHLIALVVISILRYTCTKTTWKLPGFNHSRYIGIAGQAQI